MKSVALYIGMGFLVLLAGFWVLTVNNSTQVGVTTDKGIQKPPEGTEPRQPSKIASTKLNSIPQSLAKPHYLSRGQTQVEVPRRVQEKEPIWKKAHAAFQPYFSLASKALRSEAEEGQRMGYLSDPGLIRRARTLLNRPVALSKEQLDQRVFAIDYLDAALRWKHNPSRPVALAAVEALVAEGVEGSLDSALPVSDKKSIVGDYFELVASLLDADEMRLRRMIPKLRTARARRLFNAALSTVMARHEERSAAIAKLKAQASR